MNDQWLVIPFVPINRAYLCGIYAFLTTQKAKKNLGLATTKTKNRVMGVATILISKISSSEWSNGVPGSIIKKTSMKTSGACNCQ